LVYIRITLENLLKKVFKLSKNFYDVGPYPSKIFERGCGGKAFCKKVFPRIFPIY